MTKYQIITPDGYRGQTYTADSDDEAISQAARDGERVLDVIDWQAEDGQPIVGLVVKS